MFYLLLLDPRFKKIGLNDQRAADQIARHLTAENADDEIQRSI